MAFFAIFKERLNKKIPQLDTGSVAVYGTEKFNGDIIKELLPPLFLQW